MIAMHKFTLSLVLSAAALSFAPTASAITDVSSPAAAITLGVAGTANFGDKFRANQQNASFSDKFTFSLASIGNLNLVVHSISTKATSGLDLTGFDLYDKQDHLLLQGHQDLLNVNTGAGYEDQWSLVFSHLAIGDYYLKVSGRLVSSGGAAFAGNGSILAVPEPATYAMLLGGVGLLGLRARRKRHSL